MSHLSVGMLSLLFKIGMTLAIHACRYEEATDKRCLKLVLTDGASASTRNSSALATFWCPYK